MATRRVRKDKEHTTCACALECCFEILQTFYYVHHVFTEVCIQTDLSGYPEISLLTNILWSFHAAAREVRFGISNLTVSAYMHVYALLPF